MILLVLLGNIKISLTKNKMNLEKKNVEFFFVAIRWHFFVILLSNRFICFLFATISLTTNLFEFNFSKASHKVC